MAATACSGSVSPSAECPASKWLTEHSATTRCHTANKRVLGAGVHIDFRQAQELLSSNATITGRNYNRTTASVRPCLCLAFPLPSWRRHCLSMRSSGLLRLHLSALEHHRHRLQVHRTRPSSGVAQHPRSPLSKRSPNNTAEQIWLSESAVGKGLV